MTKESYNLINECNKLKEYTATLKYVPTRSTHSMKKQHCNCETSQPSQPAKVSCLIFQTRLNNVYVLNGNLFFNIRLQSLLRCMELFGMDWK